MALESDRFLTVSALSIALTLAGCGEAPSTELGVTASDPQPIVGGRVDSDARNVFILVALLEDALSSCTATLIAPNLLLTARHCVAPNDDETVVCGRSELGAPYPADVLRASNATRVSQSTRWFRGASVHVPTEGADTCGYDIALVVLTENVPESFAVPAIPRIDRGVEQGEPYVAIGYGLDEDGQGGERTRRDDLFVSCTPGTCGRYAPETEFIGDTGVCEGDSGGPAFDTEGKLVGVVSRGGEGCSVPIYGTVTAWRNLITNVALQASTRGGYAPPFWATTGASDPMTTAVAEPGAPCGPDVLCPAEHVCARADVSDAALCRPVCGADKSCGAGQSCVPSADPSTSVCVEDEPVSEPPGAEPQSTCAFGLRESRSASFVALGLLTGLAVRRRSRRRAT